MHRRLSRVHKTDNREWNRDELVRASVADSVFQRIAFSHRSAFFRRKKSEYDALCVFRNSRGNRSLPQMRYVVA